MDVYRVHKVCQCVADDEFVLQTGYEPEQIEIFLYYNKQLVRELKSDRSASYDYLQKGEEYNNLNDDLEGNNRLDAERGAEDGDMS